MEYECNLKLGHVKVAANFLFVVWSYQYLTMSIDDQEFCFQESWIFPDSKHHFKYATIPRL